MINPVLVELHRGKIITLQEAKKSFFLISVVTENPNDLGEQIFLKDNQEPSHLPKIREEIGTKLDLAIGKTYILRGVTLLANDFLYKLGEEFIPVEVRQILKNHTTHGDVTRIIVFELPNGHRVWILYDFTTLYKNIATFLEDK